MADQGTNTDLYRSYLALYLYNQQVAGKLFIGIGKTSAWTDEASPDPESVSASSLSEPVGYIACDAARMLVEDTAGDFDFEGSKYRTIDPATVRSDRPQYLYLEASIPGNSLPLDTYRQAALFAELIRAAGVPSTQTTLLPSEVTDPGWLQVLANFVARTRSSSLKDIISFLLEL